MTASLPDTSESTRTPATMIAGSDGRNSQHTQTKEAIMTHIETAWTALEAARDTTADAELAFMRTAIRKDSQATRKAPRSGPLR